MGDGTPSPFLYTGEIMNNIFDAHAHYDDDWFSDDREELLLSLPSKGVCGIVNAAVDLKTAEIARGFADKEER